MKQTILVTGGTGFIGSHTSVELIEAGYEGSADEWIAALRRAAEDVAALRGEDALERITESSRRLLGV